ncbi:MAG: right-handed parallel beta-helix repeat-containing protein [Thermoplasmata archaeon]|nr:MAG: right-handed parallel beta-helix repeat-containing protein [Thermoplasmata archaeon]
MTRIKKDKYGLSWGKTKFKPRYVHLLMIFILIFNLIFILNLTFDIAPNASGASTIYVGGTGPGNYSKIQYAIENASDGDTVFVHSGIYNENVNVNRAISLIGEDRETTIIDGGEDGYVLNVAFSYWVNITGFTVKNSGSNLVDAGIALFFAENCRIENNIVVSNYNGIYLSDSRFISITSNELSSNDDHAIYLASSSNNDIRNNNVTNNDFGIYFSDSSSNNITKNDISQSRFIGILLGQSSGNNITYNNISSNGASGFGGFGIKFMLSSSNNIIHHNWFIDNSDQVSLDVSTCVNNVWDDGTGEGNYWSDYDGLDDGSNGRSPDDGIGDTEIPHPIDNQGNGYYRLDEYPLIISSDISPPSEDEEEKRSSGLNLNLLGLSIISIIGICTIAALYSLTEGGKYKFTALLIPLYTRIKKDQVLNQYLRGRINGYIEANPGEHYNAIKYALNINNGALTYHLRVLERENVVVSKRDGMYKRFYPRNANVPKTLGRLSEVQKRIVKTVREFDGIIQTEIAKKLDLSHQVVNYHVKILEMGGILRSEFGNKYRSKCHINDKTPLESTMEMGSYSTDGAKSETT